MVGVVAKSAPEVEDEALSSTPQFAHFAKRFPLLVLAKPTTEDVLKEEQEARNYPSTKPVLIIVRNKHRRPPCEHMAWAFGTYQLQQ